MMPHHLEIIMRTDIHSPRNVVPADYTHVHDYSGPGSEDGFPIPGYGINCALDYRTTTKNEDGTTTFTNGAHAEDGMCCVVGMIDSSLDSYTESLTAVGSE